MKFALLAGVVSATALLIAPGPTVARPAADHTTYLFVTVDAESLLREHFDLPDQLFAEVGEHPAGIAAMMDVADRHGVPLTFYFNVYEYAAYGPDRIRAIVKYIHTRGHDVQLHTHPEFAFDRHRLKMYEYTLAEQSEIIEQGRELLAEWTGRAPVAHRAGTYAADTNTLSALRANHIYVDSSYYYQNANNRLDARAFHINGVTVMDRLIQIPVTVFQVNEYARLGRLRLPAARRMKKLDLDSSELSMMKEVIASLVKQDVDTIVVFMHSWSLVKRWGPRPEDREADTRDLEEFSGLMEYISHLPGLAPTSTRDYWEQWQERGIELSGVDYVPQLDREVDLITYARRVAGINRMNYHYWIVVLVMVAVFTSAGLFMLVRTRRQQKAQPAS